jgi:FecR protein
MSHAPILALLLAGLSVASAQSVRSTHSGLLYFFDGYVFIGDEQLQPRFGRFPELAEGGVLRTELGRAEVLLTPGVFLRVAENSSIRMLSNSLSDTRIELLRGSAIIEVSHEAKNPPDTLVYKNWQVRIAEDSVARIDSEPAQVRVLSGTAEVSAEGDSVTVQRGDILPLASVLVTERATTPAADPFNTWAMNRSSVVGEDNTIAAGITDDPNQLDTSGMAAGGFTYFPPTGIASLGITYPYGLSFWGGPGQFGYNQYLGAYPYGILYRGLPTGTFFYPRPITIVPRTGVIGRPIAPIFPAPVPRMPIAPPRVAAPHPIHR